LARATVRDVRLLIIDNLLDLAGRTIRAIFPEITPRQCFSIDEEIEDSINDKFQEGNFFYRRGAVKTAVTIDERFNTIKSRPTDVATAGRFFDITGSQPLYSFRLRVHAVKYTPIRLFCQ
jgi:hypothetical protein